MRAEQLSLFPQAAEPQAVVLPPLQRPRVTQRSSLASAIGAYHDHMVEVGFSPNTVKAFTGDLNLLGRYVGMPTPLSEIDTQELQDFLTYLRYHRGVPCTPKSYARRLTSLKVFFRWLTDEGILGRDPAAPLVHEPARSPLPQILFEDQVERLREVARGLEDPRPRLLVELLLHTGIKKGECMRTRLGDFDTSQPEAAVLHVRGTERSRPGRERKLALPPDFPELLSLYRDRHQPQERLFECTARNLEYVLADLARRAEISEGVSFETLRMTSAVRDHLSGIDPERLRQKMGLSPVTWRERYRQIKELAAPAL